MMKAKFLRMAVIAAVAVGLNLNAWSMGTGRTDDSTGGPVESSRWSHLDPSHKVPGDLLNQALHYFELHESKIPNRNYLTVIDFTQHSSRQRFYLVNLKTGSVEQHVTAHGAGSQRTNTGWIPGVSNSDGSHLSSKGFYLTSSTYNGENGYSLRLDGLSTTNSNARARAIVIHPASYVKEGMNPIGRSWGCPALDPRDSAAVINKIKSGSLIYAYHQ